ncbi:MAG: TonB-dependent receptor [Metallibacterium sp.]
MIQLKRNVLAMALASIGVCAYGMVQAAPTPLPQNASDTAAATAGSAQDSQQTGAKTSARETKKEEEAKAKQLGVVAVTGFVSSITNSTAIQRYSSEIVEAVSAEQIGKLPGISIADTLGRMPGLAVQTLNGRPQVVSIHGFGPDFSTALVNGNEQVSTGNSRGVQYDQYPASWFNSVVVYLTPKASLMGQGLAGTVDLRTIQPLDEPHRIAAFTAGYTWNSQSTLSPGFSNQGYSVNGIWADQFFNNTFGVALGVDLMKSPTQIEHQQPWGYPNVSNGGPVVVGGDKNYGYSDLLGRTGLLGTLQWRPSKNFTSTLTTTYDDFREDQQAKGIEFPLFWSAAHLQPGYTVNNGFVTSGTYNNVKAVVRNDYNSNYARVYNIDWNNKYRINEDWSADVDANYSRANRRSFLMESYSGTGYTPANGATDTIGFTELGSGLLYFNPTLNYASNQFVLTDPQGWGAGANPSIVQAGFINAPRTTDYIADLRAGLKRDFESGPFSSVQFGIDRKTRNKTYNIEQDFLTLPNGSQTFATVPIGAQTAPIPAAALVNGGSCDPLAFMGVGPQVCYNPLYLLNNGYYTVFPTSLSSIASPPNWKVHEIDTTPYVQFNLDTHIGPIPLTGNFGLQVAHTNQMSAGSRATAASAAAGSNPVMVPVNGSTSYTRYLPSMNLIFGLTDNTDLRVSAARVMARARMDQMNASFGASGNITHLQSTNPNTSYFSAGGGNPKLLPTMADDYNISLEHYFEGNQGYIAASAYFLKLHDYINPNAAFLYNFAALVPEYLTPAQQTQLGTTYGIVSGPVNNGSGNVKGAQATASVPLKLLTPVLNDFGVILSADYTKSSLVYAGNTTPITVPGLSKWVTQETVYFQHGGLQARVSRSYRSSFLGEVSGISATRILQTIQGGSSYDAQVSYAFNSGRFKGMTLILQGSNLTNKRFVTYQNGDPRQVLIWENYGRSYEALVSYKFQ